MKERGYRPVRLSPSTHRHRTNGVPCVWKAYTMSNAQHLSQLLSSIQLSKHIAQPVVMMLHTASTVAARRRDLQLYQVIVSPYSFQNASTNVPRSVKAAQSPWLALTLLPSTRHLQVRNATGADILPKVFPKKNPSVCLWLLMPAAQHIRHTVLIPPADGVSRMEEARKGAEGPPCTSGKPTSSTNRRYEPVSE